MLLFSTDHTSVEAQQVKSAVETGMFDLDTAVHHDSEALFFAVTRSFLVVNAKLNPHGGGSNCQNFVDDGRNITRLAEHIHDVRDFRQGSQIGIDLLPQDFISVGVDEIDPVVTRGQQIRAHKVAGAGRVG